MASGKAPVLGGKSTKQLPEFFSEPFHQSLVHESARADMAARRRGTASTLTRGEVSMTTAKAWRQKGTGRARAGALSVPNRYGGGAAFGPKPRSYVVKVNRKARRRALRSAFGVHAERGTIAIFGADDFETPSTKKAASTLSDWGAKRSTLVIIKGDETGALKSFRNIPRVDVMEVGAVGVVDVIRAASVAISETALTALEARLDPSTSAEPAATSEPEPDGGGREAEQPAADEPAAGKES